MSSTFRIVPLIPGLVNEVVLEIFLHFVAIDRDGPSTLVLVCTAWRDAVLGSKFLQSLRRRPNPALGENRDKLEEGICTVSFDGGGPGSMSQLRMLEEVMARLAFKKNAEVDEILPADCFDLMGGVGFGGLVALLLGRLRMTISRAMEELARVGTATFPEGDDMVTPEVNIVRLRKALESMLERNGHSVEIKLRDSSEYRCKVVVFAATTAVMDHCHPFRTYRSPRKCVDCTLVDAACATIATPDHFPSVAVGLWPRRQSFAGIPHNLHNPMREVLKEAKLVFGEKNTVSLMLSLGAGQPARHCSVDHQVTRRSLIHCESVSRDLQDQLHGFAEYLRLNVDKGMERIEPDNWHELGLIETYTDVYLEMNQVTRYIDGAVQLLLQRNGSVTLGNLSGTSADGVVKFHSESLEKYLAMEFKQMQDVIQGLGIEKVTLVDAIGKHIPIPKHFCPTYAMLLDVIKVYFRHQKPPGSDLVERGDYRLLHGSSRSIVDPVEWDQLENIKLKVEMSMILRTRNNDKARCPRCRTRSEALSTNGWATCTSCSGQFQIEDQLLEYEVQSSDDSHNEEVRAEENSLVSPAVRESVQTQGRLRTEGNKKIAKEEELKFRLISVVNLLDALSNDSLANASLLSKPVTTEPGSIPLVAKSGTRIRLKPIVVPKGDVDDEGFMNVPFNELESHVPGPAKLAKKRNTNSAAARNKINIQTIPRAPDGSPLLPMQVGMFTLRNLGQIISADDLCTQKTLYPIGYQSERRWFSTVDPKALVTYLCTIEVGKDPQHPVFSVTPEDAPSETGHSTTAAWWHIYKEGLRVRNQPEQAVVHGDEMFGLYDNVIKALLQELPGAENPSPYIWRTFIEGGPASKRRNTANAVYHIESTVKPEDATEADASRATDPS